MKTTNDQSGVEPSLPPETVERGPGSLKRDVPPRDTLASKDAQRKLIALHNAANCAVTAEINNAYHLGFQEGWKARGNDQALPPAAITKD